MGVPVARIGRKGSEVGKKTKRLAGPALKSSSGAVWIVWEAGVSRDPFNRLRIKITHNHHLLVLLATSPNNDPSHKKSATVPTIRSAFQSSFTRFPVGAYCKSRSRAKTFGGTAARIPSLSSPALRTCNLGRARSSTAA
jgi:hypothetical protein